MEKAYKILTVKPNHSLDYGKGHAGIDYDSKEYLQLEWGDCVELTNILRGRRRTFAKARSLMPADEGLDFVRIDFLTLTNLDAVINQKIELRNASSKVKDAEVLSVRPLCRVPSLAHDIISERLNGQYVTTDNLIEITKAVVYPETTMSPSYGSPQIYKFKVDSFEPHAEVVKVSLETRIRIV